MTKDRPAVIRVFRKVCKIKEVVRGVRVRVRVRVRVFVFVFVFVFVNIPQQ